MPDRVIMVRESEWREMREALEGCQGVLADLNRPRGAPESIPNLYARSVEAEAKARAALSHPTPDGCGREGKHQWGGPERDREVCVNCGATRMLEGGADG